MISVGPQDLECQPLPALLKDGNLYLSQILVGYQPLWLGINLLVKAVEEGEAVLGSLILLDQLCESAWRF